MCWPHDRLRLSVVVALALLGVTAARAYSAVSAHVEGGVGQCSVRADATPTTFGATVCAGVSVHVRGVTSAALEFAGTSGGELGTPRYIPEGPKPGSRSMTTFLLGLEVIGPKRMRGPFAFIGLGVGHYTLTGAVGNWTDFPNNGIPDRSEVGFALGGGVGYRSSDGPGPLGFQLALRTHAVARASHLAAAAAAFTVGVVY